MVSKETVRWVLQAEIAAELIGAGIAVHAFNQRDIAGILAMIRTVGALVAAVGKAEALAQSYEARLNPHSPDDAIICSVDVAIQLL
jgi:ABC-type hemin transport system substrate-binding protein